MSLWGVRVVMGSPLEPLDTSFWDPVGVICRPLGTMLGALWDHLAALWGHVATALVPLKYCLGNSVGPCWDHLGTTYCRER